MFLMSSPTENRIKALSKLNFDIQIYRYGNYELRLRKYLQKVLKMRRDLFIKIIGYFEIQHKAHAFPIMLTKEHGSRISRQLEKHQNQSITEILDALVHTEANNISLELYHYKPEHPLRTTSNYLTFLIGPYHCCTEYILEKSPSLH